MSSAPPTTTLSTRKVTPPTPTLSDALALIVTIPEKSQIPSGR